MNMELSRSVKMSLSRQSTRTLAELLESESELSELDNEKLEFIENELSMREEQAEANRGGMNGVAPEF